MNRRVLFALVAALTCGVSPAGWAMDPTAWSCPGRPALGAGKLFPLASGGPVSFQGVKVRLSRSHKHADNGPAVGRWRLEFTRGEAHASAELQGEEALGEGAALGLTWRLEGGPDEERLELWPGARAPLSEEAAMACAEKAAASVGASAASGSTTTTEGGILVSTFDTPRPVRVVMGRYTRRMVIQQPAR